MGYMLVFLFVTIGLFNLIMAIFVENVMENTRQRRQEELAQDSIQMESRLRDLLKRLIIGDPKLKPLIKKPAANSNSQNSENGIFHTFRDLVNDSREMLASREMLSKGRRTEKAVEEGDETDELQYVTITPEVFDSWLWIPEFQRMLDTLEISTSNPRELFDVLDADMSGELEVDELVVGLMSLRGPTQKSHSVASLLYLRVMQTMLREFQEETAEHLQLLTEAQELRRPDDAPQTVQAQPLLELPLDLQDAIAVVAKRASETMDRC